jgi:hypothetical protein
MSHDARTGRHCNISVPAQAVVITTMNAVPPYKIRVYHFCTLKRSRQNATDTFTADIPTMITIACMYCIFMRFANLVGNNINITMKCRPSPLSVPNLRQANVTAQSTYIGQLRVGELQELDCATYHGKHHDPVIDTENLEHGDTNIASKQHN